MAWTEVCASAEIIEGTASLRTASEIDMLLIRRQGRCLALAPICPHMTEALANGSFTECLEGGAPKCNRHLLRASAENSECPGTARAPILQYDTKEVAGVLYVDPARQRLSDLRYLSCSPVPESGGSAALKINLWYDEEGESVASVRGRPTSQ